LAALAGCWPETAGTKASRWDRWLVPVAVVLAGAASAALVATNFEIVCVGLGAWLVLMVSLWLGFAPAGRRALFTGGLTLPALVLGVSAWWSAWQGQRSQFGYSNALRQDYRPAESAGPAFARLMGLRLPPDIMMSLEALAMSLPNTDADGFRPVFYGPGMEFFDRFYPSRRDKGQPLWGHWGTSYGPADIARLGEKLGEEGRYQNVIVTKAFDEWPDQIRQLLDQFYNRDLVGPAVRRWTRRDQNAVNLADSFETLALLGGNVDSHILHLDRYPLEFRQLSDGRKLLGTARQDGYVLLSALTQRFRGVAVVERLRDAGSGPLHADFKIIVHGATPENVRWAAGIDLPAGQQSITVPFEVDAGGKLLEMWVGRPAKGSGVFAGFREMEITHAIESTKGVPTLRPGGLPDTDVTPELAESLLGAIAWRPRQLVVRGGKAGPEGLELFAGGEVWLHTDGMTGEIRGQLSRVDSAGNPPTVRVVWYKGGRLQLMQQGSVQSDQPFDFHVWTAEPGGWIGIMVDRSEGPAPVLVRVTSSTLTP
ncbi:MAG TPA: hypothetical protein VKC51_05830, partial [Lacunisphaera sp.]|nr:hypothetical protein [Lacunisphaera sp.]